MQEELNPVLRRNHSVLQIDGGYFRRNTGLLVFPRVSVHQMHMFRLRHLASWSSRIEKVFDIHFVAIHSNKELSSPWRQPFQTPNYLSGKGMESCDYNEDYLDKLWLISLHFLSSHSLL